MIPVADGRRGLLRKLLQLQLPEVPSEAPQAPLLLWGQHEALGSRGKWQEPVGNCSRALGDSEGVGEGITPEQKGKNSAKAPRLLSSQSKRDAASCSLCPRNEAG